MCQQSIVTGWGQILTGELRDHLGGGRVGIDVDGKRYVGRKVEPTEPARPAPCPAEVGPARELVGRG